MAFSRTSLIPQSLLLLLYTFNGVDAAGVPLPACGQGLKYMFSFGDSYTTTGFNLSNTKPTLENPIGNPAYPGITTSNGTNWVDDLVSVICPNQTLSFNFAAGGATVNTSTPAPAGYYIPPFGEQVQTFVSNLSSHPPYAADWNANNSIFPIWFGANDINTAFYSGTTVAKIATFSDSFYPPLDSLYASGARNFLLFTAAPTSRTPYFLGATASERRLLDELMFSWNNELARIATNFSKVHTDTNMAVVNITTTFNHILDHPKDYGAPNNTCQDTGLGCLWWGSFHPGETIQSAIAQQVNQTLARNEVVSGAGRSRSGAGLAWAAVLGVAVYIGFV